MRKKFFCIIITLLVFFKLSWSSIPTTSVRVKTLFNNNWKFVLSDNPEYKNPDYNETEWRTLNLPHDWSIEGAIDEKIGGEGGFFPVGTGWYRKSFVLPDSLKDRKIVIQFDGVYMNSEVWINGVFLGRYPYGYSTFQYDITEYLNGSGEKNILAVRVDNSLFPSTRWYNGSGIYRNVWLIATRFVYFDNYKGVFVSTPEVSAQKATVKVNYDIRVHLFPEKERLFLQKNLWDPKPVTKKVSVKSTVLDKSGKVIAFSENDYEIKDVNPGWSLSQTVVVDNPFLWSVTTPEIYYMKSELICDGIVLDDQITPFGIRKLEYLPGKGMFVNGLSQKLKGVCLHHDAGSFGSAVPVEVWRYRLLKLKEMGCNAIRTSHNPAAPEFYDLCDTLGFYVMDEAFDEWTRDWKYNYTENPRGKAKYGYHLYFNQWAETDIKAMVQRDRNHPSIVMYSIGNEVPDQKDFHPKAGETAARLISYCHSEDPTRPVTAGSNLEAIPSGNGFVEVQDISGYNYIDRVYKDKMYLGEFEKYNKLIVGAETSFSVKDYIAYRDNDFALGQFIWTGIDYLGEARKFPIRGFYANIIDIAGIERPGFYLSKSMWTNEPTVRIAVSPKSRSAVEWNHRLCESKWNWNANDTLNTFVYTNCDEIELFLNGKSLGKKQLDKNNYFVKWTLTYAPGSVKAIGFKNKKKVSEHILTTTSEPTGISVRQNKTILKADGRDISFIEVSVIDKKGNLVVDAENEISVKVTGEGNLIGVDSGDMNYSGLFKTDTRKVFKGKLMITVQSNISPGHIFVEISSGNLKTVPIKIQTL